MRVTFDVIRDGLSAISAAADQMAAAQQQVSTGRRISGVGDDPLAAQQAVGEHGTLGAIDAYTRTANSASARLASADTVLDGFIDKLSAAVVAGTGARGSTADPAARAAAAAEVRSLQQSLLGDINTTFNGRYLFAGTQANSVPYVNSGGVWTYQGDANTVQVEVDRNRLVAVTLDGQSIAQGSDPADVFTVLDQLATAINLGDNDGIGTAVAGLERALGRANLAQSRLGADERGIDDASARLLAMRGASEARRSSLEDANMPEAITRMTTADNAYRAALGAVSSAERQSLLDYLR